MVKNLFSLVIFFLGAIIFILLTYQGSLVLENMRAFGSMYIFFYLSFSFLMWIFLIFALICNEKSNQFLYFAKYLGALGGVFGLIHVKQDVNLNLIYDGLIVIIPMFLYLIISILFRASRKITNHCTFPGK
jgi:hypothetical protein